VPVDVPGDDPEAPDAPGDAPGDPDEPSDPGTPDPPTTPKDPPSDPGEDPGDDPVLPAATGFWGTVTHSGTHPVSGIGVRLLGTTVGATSDADGRFYLPTDAPSGTPVNLHIDTAGTAWKSVGSPTASVIVAPGWQYVGFSVKPRATAALVVKTKKGRALGKLR
jgi:hypothetical protein